MIGTLEILPSAAPLRREIESRLRAAITQGRFQTGERLIERELCEMLRVSRPSLREALRQLEAEELVTLVPNRGPIVSEVSIDEACEIYEVRAMLEGLAARLFIRRAGDADITALRKALQELKKAAGGQSAESLLDLKNSFYDVLLTGCGNRVLRRVLSQMHNRIRLLRATTLAGRTKAALAEIGKIVGAIERRDEAAACAASIDHIESAAEWAIGELQRRQRTPANSRPRRKGREAS
ncbi:MAG TPA: GntR family transcriptional regulator [Xanthobacteraceae bacterium]|nr:GntR family transcriptional regulator [Xanthobacteraceae bacterium]